MARRGLTIVKGKVVPHETFEQTVFVKWFRLQYSKTLIFAIPNGSWLAGNARQRSAQMARLKGEGLVSGVPDLCIPEWRVWVEMKRQKGGVLSSDQKDIIKHLEDIGDIVMVCYGASDAIAQVGRFKVIKDQSA